MSHLTLAFAGTPEFSVPALDAIAGLPHRLAGVFTQPDRPAGRGRELTASPVKRRALELGLPVFQPENFKGEAARELLAALHVDALIVVAYGLILPAAVLALPRLGCLNIHASLLPRWRGAAPIERAILAGDRETGISIFRMEEGLDTGPVYAMRPFQIGPATTAPQLHRQLAELAADMVPAVVEGIATGTLSAQPQPDAGVTYARKLARDEGRLNFTEPAELVERRLRALNPAPGCWCEARGERLSLLAGRVVAASGPPGTVIALPLTIACGSDAIGITQVQRAGRRPISADELQRGFALPLGTVLG